MENTITTIHDNQECLTLSEYALSTAFWLEDKLFIDYMKLRIRAAQEEEDFTIDEELYLALEEAGLISDGSLVY